MKAKELIDVLANLDPDMEISIGRVDEYGDEIDQDEVELGKRVPITSCLIMPTHRRDVEGDSYALCYTVKTFS